MHAGTMARQTFGDWYNGTKTAITEPVGSRSASVSERFGEALGTAATGATIGALTGTGSALAPNGLSPQALGVAAIGALGVAAWRSGKSGSRVASSAGAALSALAVHEWMGSKVAAKAGTTGQVLTNKAKSIAAHGESDGGALNAGADPLITWGARRFAAAQ